MPQTVKVTHCYKCGIDARSVKMYWSRGWCVPCSQEYYRWNHRLKKYGLTKKQVEVMLQEQNSLCLVCKKELTLETLHIDHCHEFNYVRGLLCRSCNNGLGNFKDNIVLLKNAIEYLCDRGI